MQEHFDGDSHKALCIYAKNPTHVGYEEIADALTQTVRERALIKEYNPACNG